MRLSLFFFVAAAGLLFAPAFAGEERDDRGDGDRDGKDIQAIATSETPANFSPSVSTAVISETFQYPQTEPDNAEQKHFLRLVVKLSDASGTVVRRLSSDISAARPKSKDDHDGKDEHGGNGGNDGRPKPVTATLSVLWNGLSDSGAAVRDGTISYRAFGRIIAIHLPGHDERGRSAGVSPARDEKGDDRDKHDDDDERNESNTLTGSFLLDTTPPTVGNISPLPGAILNENRPTVEVSYSDAGSGVSVASVVFKIDGQSILADITATGVCVTVPAALSEGVHIFDLFVSDNAGNIAHTNWVYTIDTVAPVISALTMNPASPTNNTTPSFSAAFFDPLLAGGTPALQGTGVNVGASSVFMDGTDVTAQAAIVWSAGVPRLPLGFTYTPPQPLALGSHILTVSINDFAGNNAYRDLSFQIGLNFPTAQLLVSGPDATQDVNLSFDDPNTNLFNPGSQVIVAGQPDPFHYLLRFDLSALPPNAAIVSASLGLTVDKVYHPGLLTVRQATTPWTDTTATWNSPDGVALWMTPGGGGDYTSVNAANLFVSTTGRVAMDVHAIVQQWANGSANDGFEIDMEDAGNFKQLGIRDAEYFNAPDRPVLTINYTLPTANPTVTIGDGSVSDIYIDDSTPDTNLKGVYPQDIIQRNHDKYLVKFDLSSIPSNAIIDSATMYLTCDKVYTGGEVSARRMLRPWQQTQATWNSRTATDAWAFVGMQQGVDYYGEALYSLSVFNTGVLTIPITDQTQKWVSGENENDGLVFDMGEGPQVAQIAVRPADYWNAPDRPKMVVTYHLGPIVDDKSFELRTPAASITNPAWFEGSCGTAVQSIQVTVNGGAPFDAVRLNARDWYTDNNNSTSGGPLGIAISSTAPTLVDVVTTDHEICAELTWTPTDLKGQLDSSTHITIRKGDSLLLTDSEVGTSMWIDTGNGGTPENFGGAPGDRFECQFGIAGTYIVTATVTKTDNTMVQNYLLAQVIDVNLDGPIACQIGFQREKGVDILGRTYSDVTFTSNDSSLFEVSVKETTDYGARLLLRTTKLGAPVLLARLQGSSGPIVSTQQVDEFTIDRPYNSFIVVSDSTGVAATNLIMHPWIPNLQIDLSMFAFTCTFANGATSLTANPSSFLHLPDPITGEVYGVFAFDIEVPADELSYCFNTEISQPSNHGLDLIDPEPSNGDIITLTVTPDPVGPVQIGTDVTFTAKATAKRGINNPDKSVIDTIRTTISVAGCKNPPAEVTGNGLVGIKITAKGDIAGQLVATAMAHKIDEVAGAEVATERATVVVNSGGYTLSRHTEKHAPSDFNDARLSIGVAEAFDLQVIPDPGVDITWTAQNAALTQKTPLIGLNAPNNAGPELITATFTDKAGNNVILEAPYTVVAPASLTYTKDIDINQYLPGEAGADMSIIIFVNPQTVNFSKIQITENGPNAQGVYGFGLLKGNAPPHPANTIAVTDNRAGDTAASKAILPIQKANPMWTAKGGGFKWNITVSYKGTKIQDVVQQFDCSPDGVMKVQKGGLISERKASDGLYIEHN